MGQFSNHPLNRRHNIDSVMNSLWDFYKNRFLTLFLMSFVMSLAIQYASTMINIKEIQEITDPVVMLEKMKEYIGPIVIICLLNLLFTTVIQYFILYNPVDSENNIFNSIIRSLKYYVPFLIMMVLLGIVGLIAIALGIIAFVIGVFFSFLYIMTLYFFMLPILMTEGSNIVSAISRTFTLAHRNFWTNIGWVAVFAIILIVISLIFSGIILLPFTGSFMKTLADPESASAIADYSTRPLYIILSSVANALTFPLMPIFASILYFNGKAVEEQKQEQTITLEDTDNNRVRVEDLYAKPYSDDHPDNPENKG
jgi:hypothetical protein